MKQILISIFGAILLFGCSPSEELNALEIIPIHNDHDVVYGSYEVGENIYIISRHDLFFSKKGWIAYKSNATNEFPKLYVYKRPHDTVDYLVRQFVATNTATFNRISLEYINESTKKTSEPVN